MKNLMLIVTATVVFSHACGRQLATAADKENAPGRPEKYQGNALIVPVAPEAPMSAATHKAIRARLAEGEKAFDAAVEYSESGNHSRAIDQWNKALHAFEQVEGLLPQVPRFEKASASQKAMCYMMIGQTRAQMDCHKEAIPDLEKAIRLFELAAQDKSWSEVTKDSCAACYGQLGMALSNVGRYPDAVAKLQHSLSLFRQMSGKERDQALTHLEIGTTLYQMYKLDEALAHIDQALAMYKVISGTEAEQASCAERTGLIFRVLRDYAEAANKYEQAMKLYRKAGKEDYPTCHLNLGAAFSAQGKYDEGIREMEEALTTYARMPPSTSVSRGKGMCHGNIGAALYHTGKNDQAILELEKALRDLKTTGTNREQAICYSHIGMAHLRASRLTEAIDVFGRASELSGSWWLFRGLADACRRRGEAGDYHRALNAMCRGVEMDDMFRGSVGSFEHRVEMFEPASALYSDFVSLIVDSYVSKREVWEWEVLRWTLDAASERAIRSVAPRLVPIALMERELEATNGRLPGYQRASLLDAAFHFADQGKGRALEAALRERAAVRNARPDGALLAEDLAISAQISRLSAFRERPTSGSTITEEQVRQQIKDLQERHNVIEAEVKRMAIGKYIAPQFRKPMDMARELPDATAVLQYSLGERECWLLSLTRDGVSAHKLGTEAPALSELLDSQQATIGQLLEAFKIRPAKIGLDGLVRLARERAEDLSREVKRNLVDAEQERRILERLGEVALPTSALAKLRQRQIHHLLVVPDGSLHYVPFAMLRIPAAKPAEKQYLIEEFAVSYVPAMTTLEAIRKQKVEREKGRKGPRRELLAFANPEYRGAPAPAPDDMVTRLRGVRNDYYRSGGLRLTSLPETEKEATRVASLFAPVTHCATPAGKKPEGMAVVCTGPAACEEEVKQLLSSEASRARWRYVLFSTHGFADPENGMLSCVVLSSPGEKSTEDGFLQAQEVLDLELDTDLVMLSACQTGLGRLRAGEGVVGLSAAFFVAGAERVCASLWQVPTGPTSQLVAEFFRHLKEGKVNRAEALRQAQLTVMRQGQDPNGKPADYSNPFCWAAFVMMGEYAGGR